MRVQRPQCMCTILTFLGNEALERGANRSNSRTDLTNRSISHTTMPRPFSSIAVSVQTSCRHMAEVSRLREAAVRCNNDICRLIDWSMLCPSSPDIACLVWLKQNT